MKNIQETLTTITKDILKELLVIINPEDISIKFDDTENRYLAYYSKGVITYNIPAIQKYKFDNYYDIINIISHEILHIEYFVDLRLYDTNIEYFRLVEKAISSLVKNHTKLTKDEVMKRFLKYILQSNGKFINTIQLDNIISNSKNIQVIYNFESYYIKKDNEWVYSKELMLYIYPDLFTKTIKDYDFMISEDTYSILINANEVK